MSDPMFVVPLSQARHDDLMREVRALEWRLLRDNANDPRLRRERRQRSARLRLARRFRALRPRTLLEVG